jgi:phage terminase large subunit GpA-like protein
MNHPEHLPIERSVFRAPSLSTPSEWADENFKLPPESPRPGPWSTDWTPYLREPLDCYTDPYVSEVTMMTGAQVGKTSVLLILIGYVACERPVPMLYVMPRADDSHMIHTTRIKPAIDQSPRIAEELTGRADDVSVEHGVQFARCKLFYASANSPPSLKSKPIAFAACDEIEEFTDTPEGCPISMTQKRLTNYVNGTLYGVSTPGRKTGKTWQRWSRSDRRRYWVPCPHCAEWQHLEFEQIRWDAADEDVPREEQAQRRAMSARLHCKGCGDVITDAARRKMIRDGVWVPEESTIDPATGEITGGSELRARHRGYHLPSIYSPFVTVSQLAYEFLTEDRGDFVRQRLALVYEEQLATITEAELAQCQTDYELGTVPDGAEFLTAGIDVQGSRLGFFYVVRAWDADGGSWLVRRGQPRNWATLEEDVVRGEYGGLPVAWTFIDSGGTTGTEEGRSRTDEVYDFCRGLSGLCAPSKGFAMLRGGSPFTVNRVDKSSYTGRAVTGGLQLWSLNTLFFKDWLAGLISGDRAPWRYPRHEGSLNEYESHLRSEHRVERSGKVRWVKKPGKVRNDYLDAEVLALAAWYKQQGQSPRTSKAERRAPRPALGSESRDLVGDRGRSGGRGLANSRAFGRRR